jgi:hypothetical protein
MGPNLLLCLMTSTNATTLTMPTVVNSQAVYNPCIIIMMLPEMMTEMMMVVMMRDLCP